MNGYENFSEVYDFLMADYQYSAILEYIFNKTEPQGRRVLDLCAGTGTVSVELAKAGADVTAVDIEPNMLTRAAEKAAEAGVKAKFILADVNRLPDMRPFYLVVSTCDGLNYVKDIKAFANRAFLLIERGGKLILEFSSLWKAEQVLKNELFYEVSEDVCWMWQNHYRKENHTVKQELTVFKRSGNRNYRRLDDVSIQFFYDNTEIVDAFNAAGFTNVTLLRTEAFDGQTDCAERLTLVAERFE